MTTPLTIKSIPVENIHFFKNSKSCISHYEGIHWTVKALSFIQSFGELFKFAVNKLSLLLNRIEMKRVPYTRLGKDDSLSKEKLIVCIHGRNSHPIQFKEIVKQLKMKNLNRSAISPPVLQKGDGKLDEMVKPIFKKIEKWAAAGQDKELVLVGISNGARIARAIDAYLAKSTHIGNIKTFRFVSIVGAFKGSYLVNLAHKVGLSCLLTKNLSEEMATDSERFKRLDKEWEEGISKTTGMTRDYTFIASPHDWVVPNFDSTLMQVENQNACYAIIPGHGHNSVVDAAAGVVAEIITKQR